MIRYGISKAAYLELQGFFDTFLLPERFKINLVGKVYFNDKLYLFSRNELETETGNYGNNPSFYRLGFVAGTSYDITEKFIK